VATERYGDVHEKFHFLKNARVKTLEHLLKWFLDRKRKINEEEKEQKSVGTTRIRTSNVSHGEPALLSLRYFYIRYRRAKVLIIYLRTADSSVSFGLYFTFDQTK